ncbi:S-methyl-5'-thioinosine phosphorylase [Pseudolysobacter antarcticus]|uniref:Probable 6-oxopurine nucleoside phosphorylase n=1 Tax=Pseudolysobacter antarcticus TaxID=2511995 RepID=A0A411HJK0_9GAMM|nr:S-methyl-5'-thioinosine phosphorylase [Pseudolysobacter antarcticus]QBB70567.1 S-methyl-5'-thioinosine phosphorylase [Pseudolysobacter antarcticus]
MSLDLAVIGGTGLYRFPGLENIEKRAIDTPFGAPSADIVLGDFRGKRVAFLARHGENHTIAPHRVNYRANLWALHELGAQRVIGINAVGGIRVDMGPRVIAVPDQIVDYTHGRFTSFCDVEGVEVKHIDFSEPYSLSLRQALVLAASNADISVVPDGVYGATQGPRLETRAEIARMRIDGCDLVGMTGMPEAALARELELDYACVALVANWAAGCGDQTEVSLPEIYANLEAVTAQVPSLIAALLALKQ